MKETLVLSKLFEADPNYGISMFGNQLRFIFKDKMVQVEPQYYLNIINDKEEYYIRFCEIKEIKITPKTIVFILQDAGYHFKDGDKKIIRRDVWQKKN